ncbi:MAG: AAA family ATPase [Dehalococcoidia bacterium]
MNCPSCGIEIPLGARFCMSCGASLAASTPPPSSSANEIAPSAGFVGRDQEMRELRSALEDTWSGKGGMVLLAGEPGIGKTRIAQELSAYAETIGVRVLWGRCYEGEGAPPYWPWVQPIRSYVQQRCPEQLRSEMGSGAVSIAEIIPEVKGKLPELKPAPVLEPEQARFRMFDSITTFLNNAARSQPLMLVLDDLHWADQSSLMLLEFIAQEIEGVPLLLMGTYRDVEVSGSHPLSLSLGSLVRQQGFSGMPLEGLSQDEVRQLLETTAGVSPPLGLVKAIYGRTEGNPLFVSEITRMLIREGLMEDEEPLIGIPGGISETINRRLSRLSSGCKRVLTTASVIGRGFDFGLLRALETDLTEDQLLQDIDEALEAHIIEEVPGAAEGYQFIHALIQETLATGLSSSRRVRLHARIGEALEILYENRVEAHPAELANHFVEAAPVLGPQKLVHYCLLAGERALETYAYREAQDFFEQALQAKDIDLIDTEPA